MPTRGLLLQCTMVLPGRETVTRIPKIAYSHSFVNVEAGLGVPVSAEDEIVFDRVLAHLGELLSEVGGVISLCSYTEDTRFLR